MLIVSVFCVFSRIRLLLLMLLLMLAADDRVQDPQLKISSKDVENPTVLVNKNGDHTRAASTSPQVLKGEGKIQQFSEESSPLRLSGNPGQDSKRESIFKNSAHTIKKNEDRPRLSTSQGKVKIQQFDKDQPKLPLAGSAGQDQDSHSQRENRSKNSAHLVKKDEDHTSKGASTSQKVLIKGKENITQQSVKQQQQAEKVTPKRGPKNHSSKPSRRENPTPTYHIFWDGKFQGFVLFPLFLFDCYYLKDKGLLRFYKGYWFVLA